MQHAGWGRINPNINSLAPRLKQASAPVASHSECRRTNGGSVDESSMVCVGGKGSSVCNGDSGGPLSCMEGGRWVLRGAASWVTSKTCPGHTFSVYARVSSYINWITNHIGQGTCTWRGLLGIITKWGINKQFPPFGEKSKQLCSRKTVSFEI